MSDEQDNWVERNSKTITTLATASIPVVLAVFGFFAQNAINQQNLGKEYIELALSILQEPLPGATGTECIPKAGAATTTTTAPTPDPVVPVARSPLPDIDDCQLSEGQALRKFAVDLINDNSEKDLAGDARAALILGRQSLSVVEGDSQEVQALTVDLATTERALLASLDDSTEFSTQCVVVVFADGVVDIDGKPVVAEQRRAVAERVTAGDNRIRFLQLEGGAAPWIRVSDESMSLVNCDPPAPETSSTTSQPQSD